MNRQHTLSLKANHSRFTKFFVSFCPLISLCSLAWGQVTTDDLVINEILPANDSAFDPGDLDSRDRPAFPDIIEIQNRSASAINLAGYFLSDDPLNPQKWAFPISFFVQAGESRVLIANGRDVTREETNFKLSSNGESVLLSRPDGTLIQRVDFPQTEGDVSWGRLSDGTYAYFRPPSINAPNNDSDAFTSFIDRPRTDQESGFYQGSLTVTLTTDPGMQIRYTTDGSQPTAASPLYTGPLTFTDTTVLKSVSEQNGTISDVASRTFLFGENPHDLPVIILTADSVDFNRLVNGTYGIYNIDGRVRLDFLEVDGSLPVSQYTLFENKGKSSSVLPPLNGKLYANSRLGPGKIKHRFFPEKDEESFERILLRNTSQDFDKARLRDGIFSRIISTGNIVESPHEGYRPAVAYLNGEYIGHLNIREDDDNRFVDQYYKNLEKPITEGRSFERFGDSFERHIQDPFNPASRVLPNPNSADAIFRLDKMYLDVDESLLDVTLRRSLDVAEGTTFWQSANPATRPTRTSLHDYDFSFNFFFPSLSGGVWTSTNWNSLPMSGRFWEETHQHIACYLQHMGYADRLLPIIDAAAAEIRSEMPRTIAWYKSREILNNQGSSQFDLPIVANVAEWEEQVGHIRRLAASYLPNDTIFLRGTYPVIEVDVRSADPTMGDVRVHGYRVLPGREVGNYYAEIPLRFEADPKPGFIFTGWTGDVPVSLRNEAWAEVTYQSGQTPSVRATFAPSPLTLAIAEIHYNPPGIAETDEFVEFVNYGDVEIDISNVSFREGLTYTFPANTTLASGARIVIRPTIDYLGNLNNDGETLTIVDPAGTVIESFTYNDSGSWPRSPDDSGFSLVRIAPGNDDPNSPASWRSSVSAGGSPATDDAIPLTDNTPAGLLAYALGEQGPEFSFTRKNDNTLDLSFKKVVNADSAVVVITSSPDMSPSSWAPVARDQIFSRVAPQGGRETLTIESMPVQGEMFFRLEISSR